MRDERGSVGVVPVGAQAVDSIVFLYGAATPFVLRGMEKMQVITCKIIKHLAYMSSSGSAVYTDL